MGKSVILIYPHIVKGWQARPRVAMPMGLLCVATPLVNAGFDVTIIDQRVEPEWKSILMRALRRDPVCVGVSSMTGPQLRHALEISRMVKARGNVPVVWGGTHASLLPEQTLKNEDVDIVVQGEGEEAFAELVEALGGKRPVRSVRGLWYKENGRIVNTGPRPFIDPNQQPPLPYHLIDLRRYSRDMFGIEHLDFFTSRGCPHECTFCYNSAFHKRTWRPMNPETAVRLISEFVRRYQVKGVHFNDSNFFFDLQRGRRILQGLIEEDLNISISNINIDFLTLSRMDEGDFALLRKAGCRRLPIAVESGSKRIQQLLKKPVDIRRLLDINLRLKDLGLSLHYAFMMGFPTETEEDLAESVSLALRLAGENPNADISFNIFTPFPGTELFHVAQRHGLRAPESLEEWFSFHYRNLAQGGPWLSDRMRELVEVLDFSIFLMDQGPLYRTYEKTRPGVELLRKMYAPLARKRVQHLYCRFPVEMRLAKLLGLYAKKE